MPDPEAEVLNITQAAEFLLCSRPWLQRAAKAGKVPHGRIGSNLRFSRSQLLAWLQAGGTYNGPAGPKAGRDNLPEDDAAQGDTPPPRSQGVRLTRRERDKARADFLRYLAQQMTCTAAREAIGVSSATMHNWRKKDPNFDLAVRQARGLV